MNRIIELEIEIHHLQNDTWHGSERLRQDMLIELRQSLSRAHKAQPFDYDAAIDNARREDVEDWARCNCGCGDGNEYDRQWDVSLHTLAGLIYASPFIVFVTFFVAGMVR